MIIQNAVLIREKGKKPVILWSRDRHEMVCHEFKNGTRFCVDGGNDYCKRCSSIEPYPKGSAIIDISLTTESPFDEICENLLFEVRTKSKKKVKILNECSLKMLKGILNAGDLTVLEINVIQTLIGRKNNK